MGTDMSSYVETRGSEGEWSWLGMPFPDAEHENDCYEAFPGRDYGLFGFLADVGNYSHSPVIAQPRGLPDDLSPELREQFDYECHSPSWLTLAELLAYDYDQVFWDRRITRDGDGAALAEEGEGEHLPLRTFLGGWYFDRLDEMRTLGDPESVRVVFWFNS